MNFLATNIRYIREKKDFSQEYFAKELKWTRAALASIETGRSELNVSRLLDLSKYTKIPIDTLIKVDLRKNKDLSFINVGQERILFPISVNKDNEEMIEIIPVEASAGYLGGYDDPEYIEDLNKFSLPFLSTGTHRAFSIKGDSMLPVKPGSYIVGEFLEDIRDLKSGTTYIVLTKQDGLVYKRVYDKIESKGVLELESDNRLYKPYEVDIKDILELWEFRCCINLEEHSKNDLNMSNIVGLFQELQVELESLNN